MILDWALHEIAQTAHIWFTTPNWWRGTTPCQMWKFFILLIARSTCMRRLAISWVRTTLFAGICAELPRKGGMFSDTPKGSKSRMVNPLSSMIESFSWNGKSNNPLLTTTSLSEILPVYNWPVKVIAPPGEMPINPFRVVCGMAQWWEHSPSTNVARVRFQDSTSYMGWVCCWFSSLLREVLLRVLRFSPVRKNQHF